jgi:hypothetical protein
LSFFEVTATCFVYESWIALARTGKESEPEEIQIWISNLQKTEQLTIIVISLSFINSVDNFFFDIVFFSVYFLKRFQ